MYRLTEINKEYYELTGKSLFLYKSNPGDGERWVFTDEVKKSHGAAERYAESKLAEARAEKEKSG